MRQNRFWCVVAWVLAFAGSAFAETVAPSLVFSVNGYAGTSAASAAAACALTSTNFPTATMKFCSAAVVGGGTYGNCHVGVGPIAGACTTGYWDAVISAQSACPSGQGYTLSDGVCSRPDCVAPSTRQSDGSCSVTCPAAGSTAMLGGAKAWGIAGTSAVCISGISFGGCQIKCTSGASAGTSASCTGCTFTGTASVGADTAAPLTKALIDDATKTPSECLAAGQGYVTTSSGTVCVASSDSSEAVKTVEKTTTTKTEGGVTTTGETTKECVGGNCTTTTETKDAGGAVTGSASTTGPDADVAKKEEQQTDCEKNPEAAGCLELGSPSEGEAVDESPVGVGSITPVSVGSSGSCPGDVTLPKGQVFSWGPACGFASKLRPILIALAWLSAAFIVLGFTGAKS